jgi:hypothetical protein
MNWSRILVLGVCTLVLAMPAQAQWPKQLNPGVPTNADGTPNLDGPPPKTADGHVDLSGVWQTFSPRPAAAPQPQVAAAGTGQIPPAGGNPFGNVGIGQPGGQAPYREWAAALVKQRMADNSKDNPDAHCLPMGVMQMISHPFPKKIVQTAAEVVLIYEASGTTVREVFLDRSLPKAGDVEPWWNGYAVGHWDGDTLVVETTGFMDDGWLDVRGSPLTSQGKLTERYRRPTFGRLEIEVTVDDPKAYTKPFTATVNNRLLPDTQLIEFVCLDKDAQHYVGADAQK